MRASHDIASSIASYGDFRGFAGAETLGTQLGSLPFHRSKQSTLILSFAVVPFNQASSRLCGSCMPTLPPDPSLHRNLYSGLRWLSRSGVLKR